MHEVWIAGPGHPARQTLLAELLAARRPLYLAAGAPLLRRSIGDLARLARGRGTGAREHCHVLARYLERVFGRACREWQRIDPAEQRLIAGRIIRSLPLAYLGPISGKPGLTAAALRFIATLKETGVPYADWLPRLQPGKEADFGAIAAAYDAFLAGRRLADRHDVMRMAAAAVAAGAGGEHDLVVIDGFATLSGLERAAVAALAGRAERTVMLVTHAADRPELFDPVAADFAPWWGDARPAPDPAGGGPPDAPPPPAALRHLREQWFRPAPRLMPAAEARGALELIAAAGPLREVQEVARRIKELLAAGDRLPEDVAVVANRPDDYGDLVREVFERCGIPVDVLPAPLHTAPVAQAVLSPLRLAGPAWRRDDLLAVIGSPYLPWRGASEAAGAAPLQWLAGRAALLPPVAPAADWAGALAQLAAEDVPAPGGAGAAGAAAVGYVRELAAAAARHQVPVPIADHCRTLGLTLDTWGLQDRILDLLHAGPLTGDSAARAARELAAWRGLRHTLARLEQAARTQGDDAPQTAGEFAALLEGELAEQRYSAAPAVPGSRVRFLVPAQAEGLRVPVVFALGLAEGGFPARRPDDWVLPEHRRRELGLPTWERHQAKERLNFMRVLALAGERLVLTRPGTTADGEEWLASGFLAEVANCFDGPLPETQVPLSEVIPTRFSRVACRADLDLRLVATAWSAGPDPAELDLAGLVHRCRLPDGPDPAAWVTAVRRIAAEEERWGPGFTRWDGRLADPGLIAGLAAQFGPQAVFSASALEVYAWCGFRFFGERVLRLQPAEEFEADVAPDEQGTLLHEVLRRFYRTWGRRPLEPAAAGALLRQIADETVAAGLARLPAALRAARRRQWQGLLAAWLTAELERAGALLPAYLEVSFGMPPPPDADPASRPEPLELGGGYRFRGVIDRVDTDDAGRFVVYDYKSGAVPPAGDVLGGFRLQLPLYLAAAAALRLPGAREPGGAAYYSLRSLARSGLWEQETARLAGVGGRSRGVLAPAEFAAAVDGLLGRVRDLVDRVRAGDFAVYPQRPCPDYCPLRTACRIDPDRLAAKVGPAAEGVGE